MQSHVDLSPTVKRRRPRDSIDRSGNEIVTVGHPSVGSDVPVEILRNVYLGGGFVRSPVIPSRAFGGLSPLLGGTKHLRAISDPADAEPGWRNAFAYTPSSTFPPVRTLPPAKRKRILVTGGAGFVGSHLVDRLMFMGSVMFCLDPSVDEGVAYSRMRICLRV